MLEEPRESGLERRPKISPEEVPLELDVEIGAGICPANKGENQAKSQIAP